MSSTLTLQTKTKLKKLQRIIKKEKYTQEQAYLLSKAFEFELKNFMNFKTYLNFIIQNRKKIKLLINRSNFKKNAHFRGGFIFSLLAGLVSGLISIATTSAPVAAAALASAAPAIATAAISTGTEMILQEVVN